MKKIASNRNYRIVKQSEITGKHSVWLSGIRIPEAPTETPEGAGGQAWKDYALQLKGIYDNVSSEFTEYSRRMEAEQLQQQQRAAENPEDRRDPNYQPGTAAQAEQPQQQSTQRSTQRQRRERSQRRERRR